jgi:hypothetical protein
LLCFAMGVLRWNEAFVWAWPASVKSRSILSTKFVHSWKFQWALCCRTSLPSAIIRVSIKGMPSFWYPQTLLPMSLFFLSCHCSPLFSPYVLGCWCFHELLCGNGLVNFSYASFVKFSSPGIYFFQFCEVENLD